MTEETLNEGAVASANEAVTTVVSTESAKPADSPDTPPLSPQEQADKELSDLYDKITSPEEASKPEGEKEITDQPNEAVVEPAKPAINAPASWSAEMREKWASLPPEAQEYVAQREKDAHSQISRMGQELSQWKPVAELRDKNIHLFDRQGVGFKEGLERLLYAQQVMDQNPLQGIAAIAQTYGIDLGQAFGGQPQGYDHPDIARLNAELQRVQSVLNNQQREQLASEQRQKRDQEARQQQELLAAQQTVAEWSAGKPYVNELRPLMQQLLETGVATDLDDAYETAIFRTPEIRTKVEAERNAAAEARKREEQERAVKEAKRQGKINIGDKPAMPKPKGKWDDDSYLSQVYDAVAGG